LRKNEAFKTKNDKKKLDAFQLVIQIVFSQRALLIPGNSSFKDFGPQILISYKIP